MYFKCMNRGCKAVLHKTEFWKWKDTSKMVKVHVCEKCYYNARKLQVK